MTTTFERLAMDQLGRDLGSAALTATARALAERAERPFCRCGREVEIVRTRDGDEHDERSGLPLWRWELRCRYLASRWGRFLNALAAGDDFGDGAHRHAHFGPFLAADDTPFRIPA